MDIFVALATIVAGVIAAIQLYEWYKKQKRMRKRKVTLQLTQNHFQNQQEPITIINLQTVRDQAREKR